MRAWELAVILAGVSFAALCIYLITVLKKLSQTLISLNAILDENTGGVNDIIANVDTISVDVSAVTARTKQAVETISEKVEGIKLQSPQKTAKQGSLGGMDRIIPGPAFEQFHQKTAQKSTYQSSWQGAKAHQDRRAKNCPGKSTDHAGNGAC